MIRAGDTDLGDRTSLALLANEAAMHSRGPGVTVLYTLASGRGRLTTADIDQALATLDELAAATAARDGVRTHARALHTRLAELRGTTPIDLAT
ncbi:hypothetical protein [Embleya hyalina]|uniref:Uncharacterized protein n=1 Tax=Embleya hyalina TaxID=516124 RepID=A0A401YYT7_9ACTN|nr:hypothetical protein [Embleya hyalina]GCD99757.1 hypothetical protein EHYA_07479 [Embleya hyalina]